jgi:hypothetical protein
MTVTLYPPFGRMNPMGPRFRPSWRTVKTLPCGYLSGARARPYRLLARSRTDFTQADRVSPLPLAASSYSAFLASLIRIVRYSLSPFSTGGLPLPRFGAFMGTVCTNK